MHDTKTPEWAHHDAQPGLCPECDGYGCSDCSHTGCCDRSAHEYHYNDHDE